MDMNDPQSDEKECDGGIEQQPISQTNHTFCVWSDFYLGQTFDATIKVVI